MSSGRNYKFHQFPISLLAFGETPREKLEAMSVTALMAAGKSFAERKDPDVAGHVAVNIKGFDREDFESDNPEHVAWFFGRNIVGVFTNDESMNEVISRNRKYQQFIEEKNPSPMVRVSTNVMIEAHKEQFAFRDLAVLLAVYAIIGQKTFARVLRDRVRAGALGYNSHKLLFDGAGNLTRCGTMILSGRQDHAQPLTINQVRHTLTSLHERKFFSRIQPVASGRSTFYSRSLSHENLAVALAVKRKKMLRASELQRLAEHRYRDEVSQDHAPDESPDDPPELPPDDPPV